MGYFKRAVDAVPSVLYWGLAAGVLAKPVLEAGAACLQDSIMPFPDSSACEQVDTFIRAIADQKGAGENLNILVGPSGLSYGASLFPNKRIVIPHTSEDEWITVSPGCRRVVPHIEKLLVQRAQTTSSSELQALDEELNEHRFIIAHESSHLLDYDGYQDVFFAGALPFVTHNVYKRTCAGSLPSTGRAGAAVKIAAGLSLGMINWLADRTIKRCHEKKADLLETDPKIIRAGIRCYKKFKDLRKANIEEHYPKATRPYAYALTKKMCAFLDDHSTLNERIAYLEEHVAKIEQHAQ